MTRILLCCFCFAFLLACDNHGDRINKLSWRHYKARRIIKMEAKRLCNYPLTYKSISFDFLFPRYTEFNADPFNKRIDSLICKYFPAALCISGYILQTEIYKYNSSHPDIWIDVNLSEYRLKLNVNYNKLKPEGKKIWDTYKKIIIEYEKEESKFTPVQIGWTGYHKFLSENAFGVPSEISCFFTLDNDLTRVIDNTCSD
jgi:hypothetical protein